MLMGKLCIILKESPCSLLWNTDKISGQNNFKFVSVSVMTACAVVYQFTRLRLLKLRYRNATIRNNSAALKKKIYI